MKNKIVGALLIGLAALVALIVVSFNNSVNKIAKSSCSDVIAGISCPIVEASKVQTNISILLMVLLAAAGVYLIFYSKEERIITKVMRVKEQLRPMKIDKESYAKIINQLNNEEKKVFEYILDAKGSILQSELVDKVGLTKVKVTRLLDRLEGRGLIERKRRGMTNVVILKH